MEEEEIIKPRQMRGTPADLFRKKVALAVTGISFLATVAFHFYWREDFYRKDAVGYYEIPQDMLDRRFLMNEFLAKPMSYNEKMKLPTIEDMTRTTYVMPGIDDCPRFIHEAQD